VTAPLLPIAGAFAAGVALGLRVAPPPWVPGAGLLLGALAAVAARRGGLAAASAAVLALAGLAGWARVALPDPAPATTELRGGPMRLEGVVAAEPEVEGPRTRLSLLLRAAIDPMGAAPARGRLLLYLYGARPPIAPGDRVRVTVELREPRPFRNPGAPVWDAASRPADARWLAVGRAETLERLPPDGIPWWLRVRLWLHERVARHLPPVSGALFEGLLVGERRQLPPTLLADFRAAGVFHILAISGFNVGLVAGAVFLFLRLTPLPPRAAAAVALGALGAFAAVVGPEPSVLRATLMGGLVLVGLLLGRESATWNSLGAALLVLLGWDPAALADPGLQLSFAATAGILHLGPPIRAALEPWCPRSLSTALAISAGAQLAVTPLMLAHFNQLSLIGVAANLVVVPLAAAITILGLVAVVLAVASATLAHLAFQSLWALLVGLRFVVRGLAALPGAMIHAPAPPPLALLAIVLALALAPLVTGRRSRVLLGGLATAAILATAAGFLPDGRLHVLVLDVGQGEAILVRGPDGQALLVDTGGGGPGRTDRGERVVLPALHRAGVRRLAALAVTHGDPDHAGGLAAVLEGLPVGEVWVPAGSAEAPWQLPIVAAGIPRRVLARGDRVWLGPVLVTALHPPRDGTPADANDSSLVLRIEWGLATLLLTGDAEAPAEAELLAAGVPTRAVVLKVGHHGSRHASSAPFLARVRPRVAAISVGARNPFGHPSPAALARLAAAGAVVYRTDADGAIEVTSDGARLWLRRWANPGVIEEVGLGGAP